ncbi:hypothetical protein [Aurantiacibacter flavus]|uniref:Penicillin-binding protein transpeptidase domain-containing protein n=1 Tax=Aurantiacibacter flavus TaxID=3145232 RepID=A0ABV0CSL4_9SPHN
MDNATKDGAGGALGAYYGTKSAAGPIVGSTYELGGTSYDSVHIVMALAPSGEGSPVIRQGPRTLGFL